MSSPTATLTLMLFFLHLSRFGVTSSGKSGVENCGCPATCTPEVLNRRAGKYSCLDRMQYLHKYENIGREAACRRISGVEYPDICGPACHPDWCAEHWPTQTPTPVPTVMPTEKLDCGCPETCTEDVLSRSAGKYTCSDRMAYLWKFKKYTETEACQKIAIEDWPQACGPCAACFPTVSPSSLPSTLPTASSLPTLEPTSIPGMCGCPACNISFAEETMAGNFSCKSRVDWLEDPRGGQLNSTWACIQIANSEYPETCGLECNPLTCYNSTTDPEPTFCGCPDCTPDILNRDANGVTCGNRMAWLQTPIGNSHTELEACSKIGGIDFPDICGPECDPARCDSRGLPMCGCSSCTVQVLNIDADGSTCGERIRYLQDPNGWNMTEVEACLKIAAEDFPQVCGPYCNPDQCLDMPLTSLRGGGE